MFVEKIFKINKLHSPPKLPTRKKFHRNFKVKNHLTPKDSKILHRGTNIKYSLLKLHESLDNFCVNVVGSVLELVRKPCTSVIPTIKHR